MNIFQILAISVLLNFPSESTDKSNDRDENKEISEDALYEELANNSSHLPQREIFEHALTGWKALDGQLSNELITVVDFSLPSTEKRLWVIDLEEKRVLIHSVVFAWSKFR